MKTFWGGTTKSTRKQSPFRAFEAIGGQTILQARSKDFMLDVATSHRKVQLRIITNPFPKLLCIVKIKLVTSSG